MHTHRHSYFAAYLCAAHSTKRQTRSLKHKSSCVCSIYWQDLIELLKIKTNSIMSVVSQRQIKTGNQIRALLSWVYTLSFTRKKGRTVSTGKPSRPNALFGKLLCSKGFNLNHFQYKPSKSVRNCRLWQTNSLTAANVMAPVIQMCGSSFYSI